MGEETVGFSSLFSKLCELSFNNEATKGWDIYRRPRYTDHRRRALKRCLYETLFEELRAPWVGKLVHSQEKSGNLKSSSPKSVLNKFSTRAFELRLARKFDDADRLDHFLRQWRSLQEPANHVVNFDISLGNTIVGCEAVLRFLIELTDSGTHHAAPVLGHQNDFWAKEQQQIKKMPLPEGPLLITDSQLLWRQSLESRHYVHYGRELFECTPVLSIPGQGTCKREQSGIEVFEAVPGTFPGKAKFFAIKTTDEDMHEKESRVSVFNALVHGRTTDLQVKLSMPELPNGSKPFHTLALEQRESMDDEGFESLETSSNSSTASDQATNAKENEDIWSMALALPTQKFFTWEMEGRRDKLDERPYLSEAGPEVLDELYNTVIRHVSYFVKSPKPNLMMVPLRTLIKDSVSVLIGVPSGTFHLDKVLQSFSVTDRVRLTGVSPEMLRCMLSKLAAIGTDYIQLNMFATHHRGQQAGQVLQGFLGALQGYLHCYRTTVLSVEVSAVQSPLQLTFAFEDLGKQLRFLANVCMCSQAFKKALSDPKVKFPTGVKLLSYLYQLCMEHSSSSKFYPILLSLLKHSAMPYIMFVQTWVFKGVCSDMFGEFMIEMDEQYLAFRDKYFWTHGFVMVGRDKLDCVPLFLRELADDMFVCGKAINLLKLCCPEHYLCDPGIPLPKMEVTFSMKRLSRIEKECEKYMRDIQKMGAQLQEQREKQRAAVEDEKLRAILEERQKAEEAVAEITALVQKAKDAVQQKKREDLLMLKKQLEKAFEHKALIKAQEKGADAELMMKNNEREVTDSSVEDEIKKKAREDLIKYYEELGREIEHREARAQWTIRRRLLDTTRAQFLAQEEARLESLREQLSQASGAENVDEMNERPSLERHGGLPVVTAGPPLAAIKSPVAGVKEEKTMTPASVPSPSIVSLIASGVRTTASGSVMGQGAEEGKHTATILEGSPEDAATDRKPRKRWEDRHQSAAQLEKLKDENSGRRTWETTPNCELTIASPVPKSHPSDSSIQFTMYSDKKKDSESPQSPDSTTLGNQQGTKLNSPHSDDSSIQSSATQPSNIVTEPSPSDFGGLVASHPSSSTIQDFLYGAASTIPESRTTPSQGHPSDSSAQDLLYTDGTDRGISLGSHTPEHGHPSDSSLSDLLYPTNTATPFLGGRASPYGHPSNSQVALSGDGLNVARVLLHKSRSTWQHPSDSSVQKLLTDISILEESQKTTRGTSPPSQAQNILYPDPDESSSAVISQTRGTPPPSVAQDIMYPTVEGAAQVLTMHQTRGIPPPSVIQDIMYPSGERVGAPKATSRGHEPAVKITKIMYYLRDQEEKTEVEETPKHLEFEDVWSASLVEPLRDNFDVLDEKPLSNLLDSAMSSFPFTQGGSDDGDGEIDAAQLMSLPVLLQRSVTAPLLAQISLVNSAIVTYFVEDLQIKRHFDLFKKLLFMEDGEFALSLSNQLFEKIASGVSPQEMCTATVMNSMVNKALQLSIYYDSTEHAHNLAFALKSLPEMFKQNEIGTLDFLELRYKLDWPLNIVITEKSVVKYNKIFSFMLRLKRLSWVLRDIWFHLKHIAYVHNAAGSPQLRQLQLFRHEMQHFAHNLQGYLSNQILNVTWSEFQERLLTVSSLDDLHNLHSEYLSKAIFRSLLSRKAAPVMAIISDLCTLILKLRTQLLSSPWQQDPSTGHVTHPAFDVLCKTHTAFKEYAGFLFTVVSKLVRRGYQSHLDDFLLRINFNNFYIVE